MKGILVKWLADHPLNPIGHVSNPHNKPSVNCMKWSDLDSYIVSNWTSIRYGKYGMKVDK